ncbi:MAG TPA: NAD(P)H-binding protein [Myxococcota bacterium]|nr:NAD(P)H-binding protein [Myxococcota bacterium]
MPKLVVTGANGALGRVLLERALARPEVELVALVRSARAAAQLAPLASERVRVARVAWSDAAGLAAACAGAQGVLHLAGILIPTKDEGYEGANVETTRAICAAARAAGAAKLVLVSALFADARSANAYYASKGRAEEVTRASGLAYTIVRCPLLLACDSIGSHVLAKETKLPVAFLLAGGGNLEQPADARDVAEAALNAGLDPDCARDAAYDLVGPESLSRRELLSRCARLRGKAPVVVPLPAAFARLACGLREKLLGPGFSPDVLDVILDDVCLDPQPAAKALGVALTPLDATLERTLELEAAA